MTQPDFSQTINVSFGHCDPAQIVYYPNFFRWFDQCFHGLLTDRAGGHRQVCAVLNSSGIGLVDVGARFLSPATAGDVMQLQLRFDTWAERTLRIAYDGWVGDRQILTGHEIRTVFVERDGRLRAGETAPLKALLGA